MKRQKQIERINGIWWSRRRTGPEYTGNETSPETAGNKEN
jgi:hypothetical protein